MQVQAQLCCCPAAPCEEGQEQGEALPCAATSAWELNPGQPSTPQDLDTNTKYAEHRSSTGHINPLVWSAATLQWQVGYQTCLERREGPDPEAVEILILQGTPDQPTDFLREQAEPSPLESPAWGLLVAEEPNCPCCVSQLWSGVTKPLFFPPFYLSSLQLLSCTLRVEILGRISPYLESILK